MIKKLFATLVISLVMAGSLFLKIPYVGANEQFITSIRAREIAENFIGHGTTGNIRLFSEEDITMFEVYVEHEDVRYMVFINAEKGTVIRMERFVEIAGTGRPVTQNVTPTPSFRLFGPRNPAISLERAIGIGYEELARRGLSGTFRAHSNMGLHRGRWVWEVEFWVNGGSWPRYVEMYINVRNGAISKFEWGQLIFWFYRYFETFIESATVA